MSTNASVLICDDVRVEFNGKLIIIGIYTNGISIPSDKYVVGQLQFLFTIDCEISSIPSSVYFEVVLPGEDPVGSTVTVPSFEPEAEYTRWTMRHAVAVVGKTLRPGKIVARIVADGQDLPMSSGWILLMPQVVAEEPPPS